ncbi:MAG: glycosyltransferase [Thaumarchaeota archaeon]|nr:glycosyltransferase [Nitrososphaerota archaeon]
MKTSNREYGFTIGICASDSAPSLGDLLKRIRAERFPREMPLLKIIVVASGCSRSAIGLLLEFQKYDRRMHLIEEEKRKGKAEAINKIIGNSVGNYLLFVNSDALPVKGAMSAILTMLRQDQSAGVISGNPYFERRVGSTAGVQRLMWLVHNECSERLNHMAIGNHGSDELMAVRSELLEPLPQDIVNDGAYIAGRAKQRGFYIKFCNSAGVEIDVPKNIADTISQRRRIIFGHFQIWKVTGSSPRTVESLLISSPVLGVGIIVKILARHRELIAMLPIACVEEVIALSLAIKDRLVSTEMHGVWKRYGR